jgi:hypothetical protein
MKDSMRKNGFARKAFHAEGKSVNAYVVYADMESAKAALALNATVFEDHHLRLDACKAEKVKYIYIYIYQCIFAGLLFICILLVLIQSNCIFAYNCITII